MSVFPTAYCAGCLAAPAETAKQVALFNSGQLHQSAQVGYEILRKEPSNSLARYYYAQTLYKLKRTEDAKTQFAECYKTSKDPTMKSHCYQALKTLAAQTIPGFPASAATDTATSPATSTANNTARGADSAGGKTEETSDPAMIARKLQVMTEGQGRIETKRRQMMMDIQRAKDKAAEAMVGIEKYLLRPIWTIKGVRYEQYDNPDYASAFERSQRELQAKTQELTEEFNLREAEILADCKARAAVYDHVSAGLKSQQKIGTSQIQLTPQHSNGFVRHYVNYDGSAPVDMKARAGELGNSKTSGKTKAGTSKP